MEQLNNMLEDSFTVESLDVLTRTQTLVCLGCMHHADAARALDTSGGYGAPADVAWLDVSKVSPGGAGTGGLFRVSAIAACELFARNVCAFLELNSAGCTVGDTLPCCATTGLRRHPRTVGFL